MRAGFIATVLGALVLTGFLASGDEVESRRPLLGAAVSLARLESGDGRYSSTLRSVFRSVTPEYELKMDTVQPERGRFDFKPGDRIVNFARSNGMRVRGHTLVWGKQLPEWVPERVWTKRELKAVLEQHVTAEVRHFRRDIHEWDVVNEPIADDRSGRYEDNVWYRVIGPDYIALALRAARRADPEAKLFINEFGTDKPGPKVDALLRLVKRLRRERVPLDGVGFQAHVTLDWHPSTPELVTVLRRFTRLGLRVEITELDVPIGSGSGALADRLAAQARVYREVAGACRRVRRCDGITTWGFTDASSWLGEKERPLPFSADYEPKPALDALLAAGGAREYLPQR